MSLLALLLGSGSIAALTVALWPGPSGAGAAPLPFVEEPGVPRTLH